MSAPRRADSARHRRVRCPAGPGTAFGGIVVVALIAAVLSGCGGQEFEDRTARLTFGGRTITYDVDSCGLDGDTAFVVATSPGGSVIQAVVGVADEDGTGVPEATGITIYDDGVTSGAFGSEAWRRRGQSGTAPGEIADVGFTGSRIRASGTAAHLTDQGTLRDGEEPIGEIPFSLDARCDAPEDGPSAPPPTDTAPVDDLDPPLVGD